MIAAPQRWSVRTYLGCIAVAVTTVFVAVGIVTSREAIANAERDARAAARSMAGSAAERLGDSVSAAQGQMAALAGTPDLLAATASCQLAFQLELFPRSRLDVIGPDGVVRCSSADAAVGADHSGADWLADVRRTGGFARSAPQIDPVTGELAVTFALPLVDGDGPDADDAAVAVVISPRPVADRLASAFGGDLGFSYSVVDGETWAVLSTSDADLGERDEEGILRLANREVGGLTGIRGVPGTTWRAVVSIDREVALAPVWSLIRRGAVVGAAALAVLLASLAVVNRRIARPLRRLTAAVGAPGGQELDRFSEHRAPVEVVQLARSFRLAAAAHETYQGQLVHQALHDPLTGLPNRVLLAQRLHHSLEQSTRSRVGVAVLLIDLDGFKLINDSLGHAVGDQVLLATATRLDAVLRAGDTLARFGGDELVIVGEGIGSRAQAERLAVRAMEAVSAPVVVDATTVRVSASVGIALSDPASSAADLVRDADNAMHLAKERGRSRYEVFDRSLREQVTRRLTVGNELRAALERHELHLVYQPQIDLTTEATIGVEALLRWDHPTLGAVSPATFIPIAEEIGLMLPIGRYVLEEACRQAASWRAEGIELAVSVNLSGRQLAETGLVDHVSSLLARCRVPPDQLCLELTESVLMSDTVRATEALAELHDLGVHLSIDDFGTGYSSLAYLHRFPVDELKIDRGFVHGLTERPDQRTLVTAMVAMGSALGLGIVAEGVETGGQANLLRDLGCPTAQGYLYSRPMLAADLGPSLRDGIGRRDAECVGEIEIDLR